MRFFTLLCVMFLVPVSVMAEEVAHNGHPPQDQQLHAQFYSKWQRNDGKGSCCNERDCYPTAARFNSETGLWEAERREDGAWLEIPKWVYDNNNPNAPNSPDGRSHLCAPIPNVEDHVDREYSILGPSPTPEVFCFTPGFGT